MWSVQVAVIFLIWSANSSAERPEQFKPLALEPLLFREFINSIHSLGLKDVSRALDDVEGISEKCRADASYTLSNIAPWGLKMLDSTAKIPAGVLQGSFVNFGHYDECVGVDEPSGKFQGKHCMADINVTVATVHFPFFHGFCVPSTCEAHDLELILKNISGENNLSAIIKVDPNNCRERGIQEPSAGDWVVVGVCFAFVAIGIASTVYDVYQRFSKKNGKPHQLWSSFSFYTNGKFLLSTTKDPAMMTSLFGIRTITMGWVVLGHAYLNTVYSPVINLSDVPIMNKDHTKVIIFNSFVSVDTFFFLSGMLVCFVFFRNMGKNRTFDAPMGYLHRYIRLTPPTAAVVLLEATVFNYLGNGPWWNRIHYQASKNCQDYWWSSILYVQNYVNPLQLCLTQSWYLSADMQMYWLSPLVLYPMYLFPALAAPYLGFLILAISFMDFAFVYVYDLPANFVLNPSDDRMKLDYYPFHTRMAPWLIGVAFGYLICGIRAKKIKINLSPFWMTVGWITSTLLMTASLQSMDYFNQTPDYTALECAFFLAFHRVGWALGLGWIILACTSGFGGVVNTILSWTLFQPLAKLSFCAYLVHISVQRFRIGYLRTNINLADVDTVWCFIGDYVISNLISIPLFLLFEQPFLHIDRYFFNGVTFFNYPRPRVRKEKPATDKDIEAEPKTVELSIRQEKGPDAKEKEVEENEDEEKKTD